MKKFTLGMFPNNLICLQPVGELPSGNRPSFISSACPTLQKVCTKTLEKKNKKQKKPSLSDVTNLIARGSSTGDWAENETSEDGCIS